MISLITSSTTDPRS